MRTLKFKDGDRVAYTSGSETKLGTVREVSTECDLYWVQRDDGGHLVTAFCEEQLTTENPK